jgi:hypothetical protein
MKTPIRMRVRAVDTNERKDLNAGPAVRLGARCAMSPFPRAARHHGYRRCALGHRARPLRKHVGRGGDADLPQGPAYLWRGRLQKVNACAMRGVATRAHAGQQISGASRHEVMTGGGVAQVPSPLLAEGQMGSGGSGSPDRSPGYPRESCAHRKGECDVDRWVKDQQNGKARDAHENELPPDLAWDP